MMFWRRLLPTLIVSFECKPYGIFEGFSYHQEDEDISPTIFEATVGLGDRINNLVSSNFMVMMISVSVNFGTGDTYSCSSKKGDFVEND